MGQRAVQLAVLALQGGDLSVGGEIVGIHFQFFGELQRGLLGFAGGSQRLPV